MKFSLEKFNNFVRTNIWVVLLDIIAFLMSYLGTLYLRMCVNGVFKYAEHYVIFFWDYIPYYLVAAFIVFTLFRLYGGIWQYAGLRDLNRIIIANLVTAVLHVVISILVIRAIPAADRMVDRMPVSYYIVGAFIQLLFTAGIRFANRFYQEEKRRLARKSAVNVMLVGTGETERIVRRQIEEDPESAVRIVCIFSYRDYEKGLLLNGIPVVGNLDALQEDFVRYQVQRVILADSILPLPVREKIRSACLAAQIEIQDFSGFSRYDMVGLPFIEVKLEY